MLSDKLKLNSVRALGRLELTSREHIPGWAEIQPPLGKTCESMASPGAVAGVPIRPSGHLSPVGWSQEPLGGRAVSPEASDPADTMEVQQSPFWV